MSACTHTTADRHANKRAQSNYRIRRKMYTWSLCSTVENKKRSALSGWRRSIVIATRIAPLIHISMLVGNWYENHWPRQNTLMNINVCWLFQHRNTTRKLHAQRKLCRPTTGDLYGYKHIHFIEFFLQCDLRDWGYITEYPFSASRG